MKNTDRAFLEVLHQSSSKPSRIPSNMSFYTSLYKFKSDPFATIACSYLVHIFKMQNHIISKMTRVTKMCNRSPMTVMNVIRWIGRPKLGKGFKRGTITRRNQIFIFEMLYTRQKVALAFLRVFQEKLVPPC